VIAPPSYEEGHPSEKSQARASAVDEQHMAYLGHDRRNEARALTAALIEVVDEYNDASTCVLEDLSPSGACIHSDLAMRVGVQVKIKAGSVIHAGVIKHCKPTEGGYHIGIEFAGGAWPDAIQFPIHWIHAGQY
jgi:PilZ domain-containing protein